MDLKRILVAINSPNGRDAAFERALALARSSGAELYLLHAVPVNQRFSFRAAERLERMVDMRKRAEDAGVRVQTVEQHGDPAEIIELHANARAVDLIVMGGEARRGWGRHRSLVAERVIRRTNVPTLVVASDAPDSPTAFRNVLVAVDLSPASKDVLEACHWTDGGRGGAADGDAYGQGSRSGRRRSEPSPVDGAGVPHTRPGRRAANPGSGRVGSSCGCRHTRAGVDGVRSSHDSRTRRRRERRSRRRGTEPRLQDAWIDGPARPSQE